MEILLFSLFATLALASALSVILQKKAVYSALSLIVCLASLAFLYLQLNAQFVAIIQIIVYAGAIMVLFLFVIMLLDPRADAAPGKSWRMALIAMPLGILFLAVLGLYFSALPPDSLSRPPGTAQTDPAAIGAIENIGRQLFSRYLLPFEAVSILILIAILGAVILAKRKAD
jgi:NADH-quinone oxidoreductase subunit J